MKEIKEGKLGEIYSVEAQMNCRHSPEKRQWLSNFEGGMMFYLGCHLVDLIYRIMGEPEEVIPLNCCTGYDGVTAQDFGMVALKYKNGVSFAKTCAEEPGGFLRRQLVVCGSRGTVQLLPFEATLPDDRLYAEVRKVTENLGSWSNDGTRHRTENYFRYDEMMLSFASYVRKEKENPYTYDSELSLYRLLLRCCKA